MKIELTTVMGIFSIEFSHEDVTTDELIEAFGGLLICATFHPNSVSSSMAEYAESREREKNEDKYKDEYDDEYDEDDE